MAQIIDNIVDRVSGDIVYPKTLTTAIYDLEGNTLAAILQNILDLINSGAGGSGSTPEVTPTVGGGVIVSATAPDVNNTSILWVDLGNSAIAKYSDGNQWLPIGSVWS